jgi:hypothetical protein
VNFGGYGTLQEVDICSYMASAISCGLNKLYVDTFTYPPPAKGLKKMPPKDPTWLRLSKDIQSAAQDGGSPVIMNGSNGRADSRKFVCTFCYRMYSPPKNGKKSGEYRKDGIVNVDKGGQRCVGKTLVRRTATKCAIVPGEICPYRLVIKWDEIGFYFDTKLGSPCHKYHIQMKPEIMQVPTQLISQEEKENLDALAESGLGANVGQSFIHSKLGKYVSRANITYIQDLTPKEPLHPSLKSSDIDLLLQFFKETREIMYQVLWDVPVEGDKTKLLSSITDGETKNVSTIDHSTDVNLRYIKEMTSHTRRNQNIDPKSRIFVSVCWANLKELRLFKLFPEVLHCDATSDTNNSKNYLLTFSGRTSTGHQFIFLRIWIVNQKRTSFRWIFHSVMKHFIPQKVLDRVRYAMVDGDPQQCAELNIAISDYMPQVFSGRCSWHIVNQGWKKHVPTHTAVPEEKQEMYINLCHRIKSWLYSFMRHGHIETYEEYVLSRKLIIVYLRSPSVWEACNRTDHILKSMLKFVNDHALLIINQVCVPRRLHIRHFDVTTNSAHEGTNFGMKNHTISVKPCHSMDSAGKALTLQGVLKVCEIEDYSAKGIVRNKLWSNLPTSDHLTDWADSILNSTMDRIDGYVINPLNSSE